MQQDRGVRHVGMVYAMTNAARGNEVVALRRAADGTLTYGASYRTGGMGTGTRGVSATAPNDGIDPLSSQGSLSVTRDGNFLFCVNAGSGSISSFRVSQAGELALMDVKPSGGVRPNSLNTYGDLLYVCNVGGRSNNDFSNVTGFRIGSNDRIAMIPNSTQRLSTPNAQPSCLTFSPSGRQIVVSELTSNRLSVYSVKGDGTLSDANSYTSRGRGPFGSCFLSSGLLLVTEAGDNAVSSYMLLPNGSLTTVNASVRNSQMATCWISASPDERFAYTSNAGSGTISTYRISRGMLTLMGNTPSVPEGTAKGAPIDNRVSRDGYLYVLNGNQGSISVFRIDSSGRPTPVQVFTNSHLPTLGSQGLAVL